MSKSRKKNNLSNSGKKNKKSETSQKRQEVINKSFDKKKILPLIWKIFAYFAVVLGVAVALYPKMSVEPESYLDPKNPLKTLYRIKNEGFLPLSDVKIFCAIREIKSNEELRMSGSPDYRSRLFNPTHVAYKMSYGESDTAYCALGGLNVPYSIDYADMAIIVEYSPMLFSFWRLERAFPFTTQKNINGDVILIHRPMKK